MSTPAQRIMDLFAGFDGQHGTHGVPDLDPNGMKWSIKRTAKTIMQPVTVELWQKHLDGKRPLGTIPIRADSTCMWGSIDIDQYDIDLVEIVKRVEDLGLPLVPCRSKSGGLHLFMFFAEPVDASAAQNVLREIAASLGFAGSEIFPKQTKIIAERGDKGNWIVMPYYGGDFDGKLKMQRGLKKTGAEMTIGEFLTIAEKRRVTLQQLAELLQNKAQANGKSKKKNGNGVPFGDGPPCLQHMAASGFPEGGRNNALMHIGVFLKKAHPTEWQKFLERDNHLYMKPPLPSEEVDSVIKSLQKKDYEYLCKQAPMEKHCDPVKCRTRKHGVGISGSYPEITSLDRLTSDPPLWFVETAGERIPMNTEELQTYKKFHRLVMAHAKLCYRMVSDTVWFSIVGEAMAKAKDIEAPADLSAAGVFLELLETFLTNRMRGKTKEDLLRGAPWEDEEAGRHYFQMSPLMKFLQREGVRNVERSMIRQRILDLGGDHREQMEIKGQNRSVWWVPSRAIEPSPTLDTPQLPKETL
jgi:hypothetical protein